MAVRAKVRTLPRLGSFESEYFYIPFVARLCEGENEGSYWGMSSRTNSFAYTDVDNFISGKIVYDADEERAYFDYNPDSIHHDYYYGGDDRYDYSGFSPNFLQIIFTMTGSVSTYHNNMDNSKSYTKAATTLPKFTYYSNLRDMELPLGLARSLKITVEWDTVTTLYRNYENRYGTQAVLNGPFTRHWKLTFTYNAQTNRWTKTYDNNYIEDPYTKSDTEICYPITNLTGYYCVHVDSIPTTPEVTMELLD